MVIMPLHLIIEKEPFQQWGLEFIRMINLGSSIGNIFILMDTDYFTRWMEATTNKHQDQDIIASFMENTITRFGIP